MYTSVRCGSHKRCSAQESSPEGLPPNRNRSALPEGLSRLATTDAFVGLAHDTPPCFLRRSPELKSSEKRILEGSACSAGQIASHSSAMRKRFMDGSSLISRDRADAPFHR